MADDSYLSIAAIANNATMQKRLFACAVQQNHLGTIDIGNRWGDEVEGSARSWVVNNSYLLASEPGWGAAWDYALAAHPDDASYDPGKDTGVITDGMILSAVQSLGAPATPPA